MASTRCISLQVSFNKTENSIKRILNQENQENSLHCIVKIILKQNNKLTLFSDMRLQEYYMVAVRLMTPFIFSHYVDMALLLQDLIAAWICVRHLINIENMGKMRYGCWMLGF